MYVANLYMDKVLVERKEGDGKLFIEGNVLVGSGAVWKLVGDEVAEGMI
jgi:hypothetical protein